MTGYFFQKLNLRNMFVFLVVSSSGTILVRIWYQYGTILAGNRTIFKMFLQLLGPFSCNSDFIFGFSRVKTIGIRPSFVVNSQQEVVAHTNFYHIFCNDMKASKI